MYYRYAVQVPLFRMVGWGDVVQKGSHIGPRVVGERMTGWTRALWGLVRECRSWDDMRKSKKSDTAKVKERKEALRVLQRTVERAGEFSMGEWPLLTKPFGADSFCGLVQKVAGFDCLQVRYCHFSIVWLTYR